MEGLAKNKTEVTLHALALAGDIETFQTISLDRFDINEKDYRGYSPLMLAVCSGQREFSRYLLGLGADPNSIDNSGNSILMKAAVKGHYEIIKHLIKAGADVSYTNPEGESALDFAKISGRFEAVEVIKSHTTVVEEFKFLDGLKNWSSIFNFMKIKKAP